MNKESFSPDRLENCQLLIVASPQTPFVEEEIGIIKHYIDGGGSLAIFTSEGGLQSPESNLNKLTRDYGIIIDSTTVVRAAYHKYMHPKQASMILSDFRNFVSFILSLSTCRSPAIGVDTKRHCSARDRS